MPLSKKQKILIAIGLIVVLLVGLAFGFLLGKNAAYHEQLSKKTLYKTTASFYINTAKLTDMEYLSSSDLSVDPSIFDDIAEVLDSCSAEIASAYPGVDYSMILENVENTSICNIVVTGEEPKQITEICNMAAHLLPERTASAFDGFSCKVIDYAKVPTEPIK